jgi:superoxide dismutase, Cu-Zn family
MRGFLAACVGLAVAGCAGITGEPARAPRAGGAVLTDKDGKEVGAATLIQTNAGVRIAVTGFRLPPGPKGLHIHEVGRCEPPAFTSAGGHFNPTGRKHGRLSPDGPHAGDLPNLEVGASGQAGIDIVHRPVTLGPGPASLFAGRGTALVIHAAADDEKTDPTGNSGGRIACGVLTRD